MRVQFMPTTVSYPDRRMVRRGFENRVRFDGAPDIRNALCAQKFNFDTELKLEKRPTEVIREFPGTDTSVIKKGGALYTPRAYSIKKIPPSPFPHTLLESKDGGIRIESMSLGLHEYSKRIVNVCGDHVWYVYRGVGLCITQFGLLPFGEGDYIYIPALVPHFFTTLVDTCLIGIESKHRLRKLYHKQRDIPYNTNDLVLPQPCDLKEIDLPDKNNEWVVYHKLRSGWVTKVYRNSLFTCVGYDGILYPFILRKHDINIEITPTRHPDPHRNPLFITDDGNTLVSMFLPRWIHSPPYNHIHALSEILFVEKYPARNGIVNEGDLVVHPCGSFHGPQNNQMWNSSDNPKGTPWVDESAVMFEYNGELFETEEARKVEIRGYNRSWITPA